MCMCNPHFHFQLLSYMFLLTVGKGKKNPELKTNNENPSINGYLSSISQGQCPENINERKHPLEDI